MMFLRFGAVGYLHAADGYARNPQHQSKTEQCAAGKDHRFSWLSGVAVTQSLVHSVDKAAWVMHEKPSETAHGLAGRSASFGEQFGDMFDHHFARLESPWPLYGLVEDYFDRFEEIYDQRFAPTHRHWRPVVHKIAAAFIDGGDLRHGYARIGCENPEYRHQMLLAFSCR